MAMDAAMIERLIKESLPDAQISIEDLRGDGDEEAAIGKVMAGGNPAGGNLAAHKIAVAPFGREIDRRRRTVLAAFDLAQV